MWVANLHWALLATRSSFRLLSAPERDRGAAGRPMLRSRRVYRALSEPKRGVVGHCGADPIIWPGAWPRLPHGTGERELRSQDASLRLSVIR